MQAQRAGLKRGGRAVQESGGAGWFRAAAGREKKWRAGRFRAAAGASGARGRKFAAEGRKVIEISARMWYNDRMIRFNERMPRERARGMNAVVLAFIGDAVWSLYVREGLVFSADYKTGMLQKLASARVSAKGQAALADGMLAKLTEEEKEIFLRGRNAKKPTKSKNASVAEYNISTGFEAVVGFLYLVGDYARIDELFAGEQV